MRASLSRDRGQRPRSVRAIADAIDEYLDNERERAEREREANEHVAEGDKAWHDFERLDEAARRLTSEADESTSGPASFVVFDPDGNPILVDQHV